MIFVIIQTRWGKYREEMERQTLDLDKTSLCHCIRGNSS